MANAAKMMSSALFNPAPSPAPPVPPRDSDVTALVEALRVHPNGLSFQELRSILDRDTSTWHRLVKRALQKRRVYRTGASSSLRYHAAT